MGQLVWDDDALTWTMKFRRPRSAFTGQPVKHEPDATAVIRSLATAVRSVAQQQTDRGLEV